MVGQYTLTAGEAPGTVQPSAPVLQQEWGQRDGSAWGDRPRSHGTRGHSGSDESSRLCRGVILVPSPFGAMNLSWRLWALACGDM